VPIRAQQRIAFEYPKITAPAMQTQAQVRFNKLTANSPAMRGVTLAAEDGGVVVLKGQVASESAAKLAEKLVRLEPGVKSVRSELTFPAE
jgi:osmotically-inducible protein OsmY